MAYRTNLLALGALLFIGVPWVAGGEPTGKGGAKPEPMTQATWLGQIVDLGKEKESFTLEVRQRHPYWFAFRSGTVITYGRGYKTVVLERGEIWLADNVQIRRPPKPVLINGRMSYESERDSRGRVLGNVMGTPEDLAHGKWVLVHFARNQAGVNFAKTIVVLPDGP